MAKFSVLLALMLAGVAQAQTLCPDGSYVRGNCTLAPNGRYIGGTPTLAPDGSFVHGTPTLGTNGRYYGSQGRGSTLCPDGSTVSGSRCTLTPNGKYIGGD